jgi:lipid-binding SYLF domain-containing protein
MQLSKFWLGLSCFVGCGTLLQAATEADKRLQAAATMLTEIMATSDKAIPQDLLNKSQCIVLVPGLKKGAFIIGGKFGRGFISCRKESGLGWSAPGSVRVEGGSVGFQIGGSETDVIMLIMNKSGITKLFSSKFTLGGDASVAAGPVGRTSSAETDAKFRAEILTYSRARGVFAGISLQGATLRPDKDANEELYGAGAENEKIVLGDTNPPESAQPLLTELNRYSGRK